MPRMRISFLTEMAANEVISYRGVIMLEERKEDFEKPRPKHSLKDTFFSFIVRKKKYLLEIYKSLHREDTSVREDDIHLVSIEPLFYPSLIDDCSFLVRNKLLVLIEAQSIWTENIKLRLMEYYVAHYRTLLPDYDNRKYRSMILEVPDFELNVFYTGERKVEDRLYITDNKPGKNIDLKKPYIPVNVFTRYNSTGFMKEFFDFVFYYDKYSERYGRNHRAVEETILLCQRDGILEELLSEHMHEVTRYMEDYNAQLMKGWIEDTVNEKVALEKENLLSIGEARGRAIGIDEGRSIGIDEGRSIGIDEGRFERDEEIKSNIMSSKLSPEMRSLFLDILKKSKD